MPEISAVATAPSARFALPSDRHYLAGRHVWAQIENGIATVGVTAPLGEVLWYTPEIEYWAVDRVEVGETLATVQGRSSRTVAVGSPEFVREVMPGSGDAIERLTGAVPRATPAATDGEHIGPVRDAAADQHRLLAALRSGRGARSRARAGAG